MSEYELLQVKRRYNALLALLVGRNVITVKDFELLRYDLSDDSEQRAINADTAAANMIRELRNG